MVFEVAWRGIVTEVTDCLCLGDIVFDVAWMIARVVKVIECFGIFVICFRLDCAVFIDGDESIQEVDGSPKIEREFDCGMEFI